MLSVRGLLFLFYDIVETLSNQAWGNIDCSKGNITCA